MRQSKSRHKHQTRWKKKALLLSLIGTFVLFWTVSGRVFYAQNLECYTQFGRCPPSFLDQVRWLSRYPLLKHLPQSQVQKELSRFPEVKSVSLYRRLPQTLIVSVSLRKPLGLVGPQVLGTSSLVDSDGIILDTENQSSLPLLLVEKPLQTGYQLSAIQLDALQVLNQLASLSPARVIGKIDGDDLIVYFEQDTQIFFDLTHLPPNWHATLQVILARSKIHSKMPRTIDLRFNNPTVTF